MAYTPKNLQIFNAAYCGTLAGMGVSDRVLKDTNAVSYAGLATIAGAFAQAVDTAWGISRPTSLLDVTAVEDACVAAWQSRSPIVDAVNTNPATHAQLALAIIAQITASESYYAAEGIVPPPIPGVGPNNYVGYTVANIAELLTVATSGLNDGLLYYVQTVKSWFSLAKTSLLTANGITIVNALNGGRWLRISQADPFWLTVSDWYINALTGNDENSGQTALLPLKTHAELARRWNGGLLNPPANAAGKPCVVHILSNLPDTDPISVNVIVPPDGALAYVGEATQTLYTGSITALTTKNVAANVPWAITDSALPLANSWTGYLGKRIRITSGARQNTIFWVAKDLGAKQARVSEPQLPQALEPGNPFPYFFNQTGTQQTPQVGDPFVIEELTEVYFANLEPMAELTGPNGLANVELQSLKLNQGFELFEPNLWHYGLNVNACEISAITINETYNFINCLFNSTVQNLNGFSCFIAGMARFPVASNDSEWYGVAGQPCLSQDFLFQNTAIQGTNFILQGVGIFDSFTHAITLGTNSIKNAMPSVMSCGVGYSTGGATNVWGSGNAGAGIYIGAGCTFGVLTGAAMTVTGTLGDFRLNNQTTGRAWDNVGAAYTTSRNCTWTNFNAALGSGGFAGNAQDVTSGASIRTYV